MTLPANFFYTDLLKIPGFDNNLPSLASLAKLPGHSSLDFKLGRYAVDSFHYKRAKAGIDTYFRFYNTQRPHQALRYRTPAEVFYGKGMPSTERATERRWLPSGALESYTGVVGPSLNLAPILSN